MISERVVPQIQILLVEDNPGDVRLTAEALKDVQASTNLSVVPDGFEALAFLRREGRHFNAPRPDLILLDLNLPRMKGQEVLAAIKSDPDLKRIPVCVLTSSQSPDDVLSAYNLHANCYLTKPADLEEFLKVVKLIERFWFTAVTLPPAEG